MNSEPAWQVVRKASVKNSNVLDAIILLPAWTLLIFITRFIGCFYYLKTSFNFEFSMVPKTQANRLRKAISIHDRK